MIKFFENYSDFEAYFFKLGCIFTEPFIAWKGAGYYWLDSNNKINFSVVDTRLPISTIKKCPICDNLGENCPTCGDDEDKDLTLIN